MNQKYLSENLSNCLHCKSNKTLKYYREDSDKNDLYYCIKCYKMELWDGEKVYLVQGEAYPSRDIPIRITRRVKVCTHTKKEVVQILESNDSNAPEESWICIHNETELEDAKEVEIFKAEELLAEGEDFLARRLLCGQLARIMNKSDDGEIGIAQFTEELNNVLIKSKIYNSLFKSQ